MGREVDIGCAVTAKLRPRTCSGPGAVPTAEYPHVPHSLNKHVAGVSHEPGAENTMEAVS